jgi:hypothetical protein
MIVIIIAIIILMWAFGFVKEAITKTIGGEQKDAEKWCMDVEVTSTVDPSGYIITIANTGNIPVYGFNIKVAGTGKSTVKKIGPESNGSINPGYSKSIDISSIGLESYDSYSQVELIPVLLGKKGKSAGDQEFSCPETYAKEI